MRVTRLFALIVALVAVGVFAADASGMYHPTLGRFMQRDPGAGGPMRIGAAGVAPVGAFLAMDPTGQYADGMNVYQYVRGHGAWD